VVPTATVRVDGIIELVFTLSGVELAALLERAIQISVAGTIPAAVLSTGRRMLGIGGASGASWLPQTTTGAERGPVVYSALPPSFHANTASPFPPCEYGWLPAIFTVAMYC